MKKIIIKKIIRNVSLVKGEEVFLLYPSIENGILILNIDSSIYEQKNIEKLAKKIYLFLIDIGFLFNSKNSISPIFLLVGNEEGYKFLFNSVLLDQGDMNQIFSIFNPSFSALYKIFEKNE